MNTTDDGTEPLGEAPDVPPEHRLAIIEQQHALLKIGAAVERQQAAKLSKLAELHRLLIHGGLEVCDHCDTPWPCETARILEAAEL